MAKDESCTQASAPVRKTDRRTLYTRAAIKDALLEAVGSTPFEKTSVTEVCRLAEINRSTFYLHYHDLYDVLDELVDDALADMGDVPLGISGAAGDCLDACATTCATLPRKPIRPFCRWFFDEGKYRQLLLDDTATERIIQHAVENTVDTLTGRYEMARGIDADQLRVLAAYRYHGCIAAARQAYRAGTDWNQMQPLVDSAIAAGISAVLKPQEKP